MSKRYFITIEYCIIIKVVYVIDVEVHNRYCNYYGSKSETVYIHFPSFSPARFTDSE